MSIDRLLMAPRWKGVDIGLVLNLQPFFVALVDRERVPIGGALDIRKYVLIAADLAENGDISVVKGT